MTDAYDPGVSSPAQPVVGNRKHHYLAIATHSGIAQILVPAGRPGTRLDSWRERDASLPDAEAKRG
jgi:hypothetical protein